jgi:hypothetical protein
MLEPFRVFFLVVVLSVLLDYPVDLPNRHAGSDLFKRLLKSAVQQASHAGANR